MTGLRGVAIHALTRRKRALVAAVVAQASHLHMANGDGMIWDATRRSDREVHSVSGKLSPEPA
jgi:hypothetical protein